MVAQIFSGRIQILKATLWRVLAEPLTQFLALGGLMFLAYGVMNFGDDEQAGETVIEVSLADIDRLSEKFEKTWRV